MGLPYSVATAKTSRLHAALLLLPSYVQLLRHFVPCLIAFLVSMLFSGLTFRDYCSWKSEPCPPLCYSILRKALQQATMKFAFVAG